jgi:hypothetical protein
MKKKAKSRICRKVYYCCIVFFHDNRIKIYEKGAKKLNKYRFESNTHSSVYYGRFYAKKDFFATESMRVYLNFHLAVEKQKYELKMWVSSF